MVKSKLNNALAHYQSVSVSAGVEGATPHRLVQMLLQGVLGKLAVVKGLMSRGDVAKKGEVIGQAMAIVGGLRSSLDMQAGGELAANLDGLYEYMERRLLTANLDNDVDIVIEVTGLLREIKSGWDAIPVESRTKITPESESA